ncbi:transporter substrate-binding domain-containing protein [Fibrobacter sp.]|uniref:transporter substrate-binding domain-containing protein n=1 Tax=Fibrobacter sp. TaxID=35828 RepID=UPI00388DCF7C
MKKFFSVVSAIACIVALSGCNEKKLSLNSDYSYNRVKASGILVMGHMGDYPPMVFTDKDSNVVGFDVDLAREVCSRLGLRLKLHLIPWADKEKELNTGNIDCVWNGMSVDESRASAMNLSDPYLTNRLIFAVKNKSYSSLDSLKGKRIGVQNASTAWSVFEQSEMKKEIKEIVLFESMSLALEAMEQDSIDAVFMDEVGAKYWNVLNNKDYLILEDGLHNEVYAVGFRKADKALRDTINAVLTSMKKDGKFVDIAVKWFGK